MIITRYAVCMLLLTIWADVSLAAQESIITTVAGNGHGAFAGDGGPASEASLNMPGGVAVDARGNVYIADWQNHRIRKIDRVGIISTVAGNGRRGFSGDGGPAVDASLDLMYFDRFWAAGGIALDSLGNLYIADTNNHRIRKVDLNGVITTVVGGGVLTTLSYPSGITVDRDGSIYIAETGTGRLSKASPDGTVRVLVCCFTRATGVAVDGEGNIYVADPDFNYDGMIFKVNPTSGKVEAMAEDKSFEWITGTFFYPPWTGPWSLVVDPNGDVLIAETGNRIVKLTRDENVLRIAGNNDGPDFSGDGGPARQAALASPFGVALDAAGNIYVADTYNNRIRMIGSAIPTLTVNSTYCIGSSWSLQVSKAAASSDIRLLGSSNGVTWEIPRWGNTQADGTFTESGTFAEGTQGSYTLRLEIGGTFSKTISFVVSDCRP